MLYHYYSSKLFDLFPSTRQPIKQPIPYTGKPVKQPIPSTRKPPTPTLKTTSTIPTTVDDSHYQRKVTPRWKF
ncbi:hypothetical protein L1987_77903 [Smallanthus sonchifolius]|uniref:Uncharacterized protein n=1 Tax=Smallanthus sonchifolius TaxID=185202 RepID=A0ACB8ZAA7_9ASTR|nr:hypothetical protein L1987_77903 [Smallanthus sonchifolius]